MLSSFRIYKPGQGRYVRIGTGVAAGIALAGFCYFLRVLFEKTIGVGEVGDYIKVGVPVGFFGIAGIVLYWLMNKPRMVDFLIATESEMKKVSWSSRKELVGSTIVVIVTIIVMAVFLYFADSIIYWLMQTLRVYRVY